MNKDELKGKAQQVKGKVKQAVAETTGDPHLHEEGLADEDEGKARETVGTARRKVGEVVERVGEKIKR